MREHKLRCRSLRRFLIWALGLSCLSSTLALSQSIHQELPRPEWSIGDSWTYRIVEGPISANPGVFASTRTFTVLERRSDRYRVSVTTQEEYATRRETSEKWGISQNLNNYYRENAQLPYTELEFLRFPLAVGQAWTFEHPTPDGGVFLWSVRVDGWDEVTVPAGKFATVVIKVEGQKKGGDLYLQRRTIWYAPSAKTKVKEQWSGQADHGVILRRVSTELLHYQLR